MPYKGVPLQEALDNLTNQVREDLAKEGLKDMYFKAETIVVASGIPAICQTIHSPEGTNLEQYTRFQNIVGKRVRDFFKERYGL